MGYRDRWGPVPDRMPWNSAYVPERPDVVDRNTLAPVVVPCGIPCNGKAFRRIPLDGPDRTGAVALVIGKEDLEDVGTHGEAFQTRTGTRISSLERMSQ